MLPFMFGKLKHLIRFALFHLRSGLNSFPNLLLFPDFPPNHFLLFQIFFCFAFNDRSVNWHEF